MNSNILIVLCCAASGFLGPPVPRLSSSVYLSQRSLPHLIGQSKQLLALFEELWAKINLNKREDLGCYRNIKRVRAERMKEGNKRRSTQRMSLLLNVRKAVSVFLSASLTYIRSVLCLHI